MSGVTKTAWDVLSWVENLCGMFCPGSQKMALDVLSRDVLSSPWEKADLNAFTGQVFTLDSDIVSRGAFLTYVIFHYRKQSNHF